MSLGLVGFLILQIFSPFLALLICGAAAFCLFFLVLDKRAIRIVCPHCQKYIATNTPWVCGFCEAKNQRVADFPFVYQCQHCEAEPKAYQCHHCEKLIFFTNDEHQSGYAISAAAPVKPKPVEDVFESEFTKKKKGIQLKELDVEEAHLDVRLKDIKKTLEPEKTIGEKYSYLLKTEDDARRLRAHIDEEFRNDEDERMRRHRIVDAIMRSLL